MKNLDNLLYNCRPTACTLFMSSACNFRCPHCARSLFGGSAARDMSLSVVKRTLEIYPEITSFTLAGFGEPTLCAEFAAIVGFLAANRKDIGVITNGTNIAPLVACQGVPLSITISLYGYDRESYRASTGQDVFPEVIDNYERLLRQFQNVGFSLIVGRDNWQELGRFLELFDRINPAFVVLVNHLAYNPDDPSSLGNILTRQDADLLRDMWEQCGKRSYIQRMPVLIDRESPALRCRSYNYLINVDGDGNIGGCQRQLGPAGHFGNILSMSDPFNSPEMIRLRKHCGRDPIHEECQYCFGNWVETGFLMALTRSKFGFFGKLRNALR